MAFAAEDFPLDNATMMELLRQLLEIDLRIVLRSDDVWVGRHYLRGNRVLFPVQFPVGNSSALIFAQDFPSLRSFFSAHGLKQLACLQCITPPCPEHRAPGCMPPPFVCGWRCVGGVTLGVAMMIISFGLFVALSRVSDLAIPADPYKSDPFV